MRKLEKPYSEHVGTPIASLRFLFDGKRINDEETPKSLEMVQDDVIHVFHQQTGGVLDQDAELKTETTVLIESLKLLMEKALNVKKIQSAGKGKKMINDIEQVIGDLQLEFDVIARNYDRLNPNMRRIFSSEVDQDFLTIKQAIMGCLLTNSSKTGNAKAQGYIDSLNDVVTKISDLKVKMAYAEGKSVYPENAIIAKSNSDKSQKKNKRKLDDLIAVVHKNTVQKMILQSDLRPFEMQPNHRKLYALTELEFNTIRSNIKAKHDNDALFSCFHDIEYDEMRSFFEPSWMTDDAVFRSIDFTLTRLKQKARIVVIRPSQITVLMNTEDEKKLKICFTIVIIMMVHLHYIHYNPMVIGHF